MAAWCSGVCPSLSWIFTSALCSMNNLTRFLSPFLTDWCSAVRPALSRIFTPALYASNNLTRLLRFFLTDKCKGVEPELFWTFTPVPCLKSKQAAMKLLQSAVKIKGVSFLLFLRAFTSAPRSMRVSINWLEDERLACSKAGQSLSDPDALISTPSFNTSSTACSTSSLHLLHCSSASLLLSLANSL